MRLLLPPGFVRWALRRLLLACTRRWHRPPGEPRRLGTGSGGSRRLDDSDGVAVAEFIYTMYKTRKAHGDKVILDDVTLSFMPGAKIGVVGPNGAGKSTVLKIMAGLEHASNGEARLSDGYTVGILMQEPVLNEDKTVLGNVQEGAGETMAKLLRFNE